MGGGHAHRAQERQAQPEGVEEGQDRVEGLLADFAGLGGPHQGHLRVGAGVGVGEGHGFGGPRGSAGVEQDRDLVDLRQRMPGGQRGRRRRQIVPGGNTRGNPSAQVAALGPSRGHRQPQGQTAGPRQASRQVDGKDSQIPHPGAIEGAGGLDEACQGLLPGDDDASAVELDLLADLRGRGQRVVLGDDGADPPCGVGDDHVLGAVGQDDADDVAAAHAQAPQGLGGVVHLLAESAVGGGPAQEVQGHPVGETAGGVVEHAREGFGDGRDDTGNARCVVGAQIACGRVGRRGHGGGAAHGVPFLEGARPWPGTMM